MAPFGLNSSTFPVSFQTCNTMKIYAIPIFLVRLSDLKINNGLHLHGILCVPWTSRLKVNVPTHYKTQETVYAKKRLLRIDVKPIYSADLVDYAFKSLKNGNATSDDIQVYH